MEEIKYPSWHAVSNDNENWLLKKVVGTTKGEFPYIVEENGKVKGYKFFKNIKEFIEDND